MEVITCTIKLDDAQVVSIIAAILYASQTTGKGPAECVREAKALLYQSRAQMPASERIRI